MLNAFHQLAEDIKRQAGDRRIVYIPNAGNWGDGLIRHATRQFFSDYAIEVSELSLSHRWGRLHLMPWLLPGLVERYFFIYGGGGAWCETYPGGMRLVRYLLRFTEHVLVLPSTYEIGLPGERGTFYSRGRRESLQTMPEARFCHDMALYLHARAPGQAVPYLATKATGIFIRQDRESALGSSGLPEQAWDISAMGNERSCGDIFLRSVAAYRTIFTDRLHVAIAGCMSGRSVHLMSGNYFKIREIHQASLAEEFPDLRLYSQPRSFLAALQQRLDSAAQPGAVLP